MNSNIEDLIKDLKSFQESDTVANHKQLLKLCDILLNDFPDQLRKEPFYSFSLDVINELMELRLDLGSKKQYDGSDLYSETIIREMNLLKKVVRGDEKMQKIINRLFRG
jgi:hypothetical protein